MVGTNNNPPGDMPGIRIEHQNIKVWEAWRAAIIVHGKVRPTNDPDVPSPSDFSVFFDPLYDALENHSWIACLDGYHIPSPNDALGDDDSPDPWIIERDRRQELALITRPGFLRTAAPYVNDDWNRLWALRPETPSPSAIFRQFAANMRDPGAFEAMDAVFYNCDGMYWSLFAPD